MADNPDSKHWTTLDRDLGRISQVEHATAYASRPMVAPGIALTFMVQSLAAALFFHTTPVNLIVVAAWVVTVPVAAVIFYILNSLNT